MLIVDRIEGNIAVCEKEDRSMVMVPLASLPTEVKEGDCLRQQGEIWVVDAEETQRRRQKTRELLRRLIPDEEM